MGFMDKAKQTAEQAQQKIEETQKQFNDSQAASSCARRRCRDHAQGRPIPPSAATPPASDPPVAEGVSGAPASRGSRRPGHRGARGRAAAPRRRKDGVDALPICSEADIQ